MSEDLVLVDAAYEELVRDRRTGTPLRALLDPLIDDGVIARVMLDPPQTSLWVDLAGAPEPDDLDDGEAATLAFAALAQTAIALDETKARRICAARFPDCAMISTIDVFRRQEVVTALAPDRLTDALLDALMYGRMRVPRDHIPWVVDRIGLDAALRCSSLPRAALNAIAQSPQTGIGRARR